MEKLQEKILGLAALALAVSLGLNVLLGQRSGLLATRGAAFVMLVALAVVLAVFARARLGRLAAQEQRDEEIARREKPESALFEREEGEFEPFTMARSRRQFERFVVPAVAPLLAVLELLFAWNLRRALGLPAGPVAEAMLAGSFLVGQAFVLFLLSRYLLGLSRSPEHRLMRGPGVYLGVTCFAALAAGAACFVAGAAAPRADRVVVWIFIAALAVLAVENLLATLAWIYQPRRAEEPATSYETRLGALLTDPAAWVRNVAQALDYQFGFEVSQTWFYRFLQNALVPLLVFQLLVLYLLSCLVFLGPEEEGILERFGRP
ncbi:MAG: hypothetical protein JXB04_06525, partial [Kiritimatiellae bacterium]|nr:hypothetical protein [Kiritimatiellia bacterium]